MWLLSGLVEILGVKSLEEVADGGDVWMVVVFLN